MATTMRERVEIRRKKEEKQGKQYALKTTDDNNKTQKSCMIE